MSRVVIIRRDDRDRSWITFSLIVTSVLYKGWALVLPCGADPE
jgi:hypothetical protein